VTAHVLTLTDSQSQDHQSRTIGFGALDQGARGAGPAATCGKPRGLLAAGPGLQSAGLRLCSLLPCIMQCLTVHIGPPRLAGPRAGRGLPHRHAA
jgi:hypothetical protein